MRKNFLKRSMASILSFAMLVSAVVPSPAVYAEEMQITDKISQDFIAKLGQTKHGKVSFVFNGSETQNDITCSPGDLVEMKADPDEGFDAAKIEIKDADKIFYKT